MKIETDVIPERLPLLNKWGKYNCPRLADKEEFGIDLLVWVLHCQSPSYFPSREDRGGFVNANALFLARENTDATVERFKSIGG